MSLEEAVKWLMTNGGMVISHDYGVMVTWNKWCMAVFTDTAVSMVSEAPGVERTYEETLEQYKKMLNNMKLPDAAIRFEVYRKKWHEFLGARKAVQPV